MKVFLIIFVLISFSLVSNEDSQYAKTIRETAKSMGYQLTEEELETWIERLKSYNSNDIEKFDEDINAFVVEDQISPPAKNKFLFIGSSSIRLWKSLSEDMAPLEVINRGFGGAHIKHINRHFESIVLPYEPKAIIFFCGTNDIAAYNPVEKVKLDFEIFYNRVKSDLPNTKLFVIEIQPSPSRLFKITSNLNGTIIWKILLKKILIFLLLMSLKPCLQKTENLEESFIFLTCCI